MPYSRILARSACYVAFAALLAANILMVMTERAHAYLDPGAGSLILQGLVAGLAMGLFALRQWWQQVRQFFSKIFKGPRGQRADGESGNSEPSRLTPKA